MNLRRTRAVARKEFLHILRDPRSLGMALALPFVMILLFGYALSLDVDRIPTVMRDQDQSEYSRALLARFHGSRFFDVLGYVDDHRPIDRSLDRSEALLAVVIPESFSRDLLAGRRGEVQLILDGSDSNTASIALGYAESIVQSFSATLLPSLQGGRYSILPIESRSRIWYNSELKSKNYIVPGLIAVIMTIIAALLTSLTIAREWETGTMEQVLSTPVRSSELVLGKMLAFFTLGIVDTVIAILTGVFIFEVPLRGNLLLLAVSCCIFLLGALCWGVLISAIARSQLLAYQMGMISSFLPAFLLSGFIYAIENMPAVIQGISHVTPARYFVTILTGVFLKGVGIEALWIEIAFLLGYVAIVFSAAARVLRSKIA